MDPRALGSISFYLYVLAGVVAGFLWPRVRKRRGFSFVAAMIAMAIAFAIRVIALLS